MEKETKIINWGQYFVQHKTVSAVKGVELVSDRMSYIILKGRWCNIIVLNAHAPTRGKVITQKTVFMENKSRFSIIFLSTTRKFW